MGSGGGFRLDDGGVWKRVGVAAEGMTDWIARSKRCGESGGEEGEGCR